MAKRVFPGNRHRTTGERSKVIPVAPISCFQLLEELRPPSHHPGGRSTPIERGTPTFLVNNFAALSPPAIPVPTTSAERHVTKPAGREVEGRVGMIARHKNAPDPGRSLRALVEQPSPKDCSRGTIPFGLLHCNRKPALGKGNAPLECAPTVLQRISAQSH